MTFGKETDRRRRRERRGRGRLKKERKEDKETRKGMQRIIRRNKRLTAFILLVTWGDCDL